MPPASNFCFECADVLPEGAEIATGDAAEGAPSTEVDVEGDDGALAAVRDAGAAEF